LALFFREAGSYKDDMWNIFRRGWRLGAVLNENRGSPWGGGGGGSGSGGSGGDGPGGGAGGDGGDGGGPRNPWGGPTGPRKPGRGAGNVTSFDEFLKKGRDRFGGRFPSGGDGRPYWLYGLIAFLLLWVLFTSIHRIGPQENGVVTVFGRYWGTLEAGPRLTFPAPIARVEKVDVLGIREFTIPNGEGENLILTGDQNVIDLTYTVRWTIQPGRAHFFAFQLVEPADTIKEVAESTMRAVVSRMTLEEVIGSGRSDIEARVQEAMQQLLDDYRAGVAIRGVAVNRSAPPAPVNPAFLEVSAAQQQAQSYINDARAYALQLTARAQGEAAAFEKVYAEYKAAPEVTRRRMYYETMERILSRIDSTIIEAPGVTPYLPLPEVRRRSQAAPPAPPAQPQAQAAPAQGGR
jgi:membrane protease subunit HflK